MLAVSGIDNTIKIFSADGHARENAENGIDVHSSASRRAHSSSLSPRARARRHENADARGPDGLSSKKRLHDSYAIMSQNDVHRQGGLQEAYITVGLFPRITTHPLSFAEWIAWIDG